jgi:iron complex outermembrane receptor protein
VFFPTLIGSALFEQERKRTGGMFSAQWKPTDTIDWKPTTSVRHGSGQLQPQLHAVGQPHHQRHRRHQRPGPLPGYVVRNNTLVSAEFAPTPGGSDNAFGIYDQISRPGAKSSTESFSLEGKWTSSDKLNFSAQAGTRRATARHRRRTSPNGTWASTAARAGSSTASAQADWAPGQHQQPGVPGTPNVDYRLDWIFGYQDIDVEDKEDWGQIDAPTSPTGGVLQSVDFGIRAPNMSANLPQVTAQGPELRRGDLAVRSGSVAAGLRKLSGAISATAWAAVSAQHLVLQRGASSPSSTTISPIRDPVSRFFYLGRVRPGGAQRGGLRAAELRRRTLDGQPTACATCAPRREVSTT